MGRNSKLKKQKKESRKIIDLPKSIKLAINACLTNNRRVWVAFPQSRYQEYCDAICLYGSEYPVLIDLYKKMQFAR